jgi:glycosyltransferase involved in cell wall biosynthesis
MRISWLSVSDQLGGSEVALLSMITGLRDARPDWQCQVVLPGNGPLRERVEAAGAQCAVVPMPPALARVGESAAIRGRWSAGSRIALGLRLGASAFALPAYEARLARTLSSFQPDIIHTNGFKAHVLGARVRLPHCVVVWHVHEYVSRRRLTRWLMRRYAGRCDAIVANSASVAADIATIFGTPPPVHVVRNAVDLRAFTPEGLRLDLDALAGLPTAPDGVTRVGLVGTFARWKGQDVFLDALQRVPASRPIRGYIIGGPLYDTSGSQYSKRELEAMIDARNLRSRVGLTGFLESAPALRSLDVVVHASSEPEPFGLVIAEAMACGRAVITTAHGGAAELIEAGRDALVAPAGDARALATAIDRLAADPMLRESIGSRARAAAVTRFAPDRMAADLVRIFETAGETAGPHRPLAQSA